MPGHVRAADAPEDLWRCTECGWTYPNHHPSAKHRRNHKKQCGKIPGFTRSTDLTSDARIGNGSSDDGSSDEGRHLSPTQDPLENGYHLEHPPSPTQEDSSTVEHVCDTRSRSNVSSKNNGVAHITPNIPEETGVHARNLNLPDSKDLADMHNGNDQGRSNVRSAHAFKGRWTCRHCGWLYPNAHPSAKNRRKHKKTCGIGAQHAGAGGSSDEVSSDDGIESTESAGTPELPTSAPGPQIVTEVSAQDTDQFKDMQEEAEAEIAQVSSESDRKLNTHLDGVLGGNEEEKLESGQSQVAVVDEGNVEPTDEQASVTPDTSPIPVQRIETTNSKQSQMIGEVTKRAVSNGVKPSDPVDGTVSHVQVGHEKPHLPEPSQRVCARDDADQSIHSPEQRDSEGGYCQQRAIVDSPERATKSPQPKPALRAVDHGESLNAEERSSPGSPEGLVRSRVEIFEKLAGSSPQHLRKSGSPNTNHGSPQLAISSRLQNGTVDTKTTRSDSRETAKNSQETVSDVRHQRCSERMTQSGAKLDASSELQEVMSHVLHRVNFV